MEYTLRGLDAVAEYGLVEGPELPAQKETSVKIALVSVENYHTGDVTLRPVVDGKVHLKPCETVELSALEKVICVYDVPSDVLFKNRFYKTH